MTTTSLTPDELRKMALFAALPTVALEHLLTMLTILQLQAGDLVFREGDTARDMFVVIDGEMEVVKHSKRGTEARVALLGPGDSVGEMGLVDIQPRSATVRAVAPTRLLRITAADLDSLYRYDLKSYAFVVLNLARELSRRLRVSDGIIADFTANLIDNYLVRRER